MQSSRGLPSQERDLERNNRSHTNWNGRLHSNSSLNFIFYSTFLQLSTWYHFDSFFHPPIKTWNKTFLCVSQKRSSWSNTSDMSPRSVWWDIKKLNLIHLFRPLLRRFFFTSYKKFRINSRQSDITQPIDVRQEADKGPCIEWANNGPLLYCKNCSEKMSDFNRADAADTLCQNRIRTSKSKMIALKSGGRDGDWKWKKKWEREKNDEVAAHARRGAGRKSTGGDWMDAGIRYIRLRFKSARLETRDARPVVSDNGLLFFRLQMLDQTQLAKQWCLNRVGQQRRVSSAWAQCWHHQNFSP